MNLWRQQVFVIRSQLKGGVVQMLTKAGLGWLTFRDFFNNRGKRHSTPATLIWMDEHYHLVEGVCIPRSSSLSSWWRLGRMKQGFNFGRISKIWRSVSVPFAKQELCLLQLCWLLLKDSCPLFGFCRNSVYFNYVDFCSKNGMTPVNAASFGKVAQTMTKRNTDNTVRV